MEEGSLLEQLGVQDLYAAFFIVSGQPILPTRGKFQGTTKGTSIASLTTRRFIKHDLKYKMLPTVTGTNISNLRLILHRNLGVFVGRAVPVVGWLILTWDVIQIVSKTIDTYNSIVKPEDRIRLTK